MKAFNATKELVKMTLVVIPFRNQLAKDLAVLNIGHQKRIWRASFVLGVLVSTLNVVPKTQNRLVLAIRLNVHQDMKIKIIFSISNVRIIRACQANVAL